MPSPHAASIDPSTAISVTFSNPLASGAPQFRVTSADGDLAGTVTVSSATLMFAPKNPLPAGTAFSVSVASVIDVAGNQLGAAYQFDFTTRTTLCVKPGGADGCYALPSAAVAAAKSGDSIAILEGDYMDSMSVDKPLVLLGGFASNFTVRDPANHPSVIHRAATPSPPLVLVQNLTPVVLEGLTLTDGKNDDHGGAVRIENSTVRISNCVIKGNNAFFTGGGIYITGGSSVQLIGNTIDSNTVGGQDSCSGAGISVESSNVTLRNNAITNNRVLQNMGTGAGMLLSSATAVLTNNQIENNHSTDLGQVGNGGGITNFGSQITILGGTLSRNDVGESTGTGGGLYSSGGSVRLDGVRIESNTAGEQAQSGGSAIHAINTKLVVASSIVASNTSSVAAIVSDAQSSVVIANSTLADNKTRAVLSGGPLTVVNSVLLRDTTGLELATGKPSIVRQNSFFGNTTDATGVTLDASNLTVDPQLDAALHLMASSPLIDAGLAGPISTPDLSAPVDPPTQDIDGDARVIQGRTALLPDIGADEYNPAP